MPKIDRLVLRCSDPQSQRQFYCDVLGMSLSANGSVGYGGDQASIQFTQAENQYTPQNNDTYWKIALAVENIDLAYHQLVQRGIQISKPKQFQNVGYLAHFTDPEGFTIELIEHWFEGHRPDKSYDEEILGGGVCFNLLTLRTAEVEKIKAFCRRFGMTPLSVQPVESHGFTLYFFAFTSDVPPGTDLQAIENREWLYQRQYTVLEFQHVHDARTVALPHADSAGYGGAVFTGCVEEFEDKDLLIRCSV